MCVRCGAEKPLSEYYNKDKTCKECRCAAVRANRAARSEQYKAYEQSRASNPDRVKARREYIQTEAGKESKARTTKRYREDYPKKYAAHNAVNNAVRDGILVKLTACQGCGSGHRVEGHHDDYDKPLEVRWLCTSCHNDWHAEHGEARNPF